MRPRPYSQAQRVFPWKPGAPALGFLSFFSFCFWGAVGRMRLGACELLRCTGLYCTVLGCTVL